MNSGRVRRTYLCSFCGKNQDQVQRLIAGPGGVYICGECVDVLANEKAGQPDEVGTTANAKQPRVTYRCSFCAKNQDQVQHLHIGPGEVKICSECIALCREIINEEQMRR